MPAPLAAGLLAGLAAGIGPLVIKALGAIGVGVVTYVGVSALLDEAYTIITANLTGGPFPQLIAVLGVMQIDTAITMIFSAFAVRMTLKGVGATGAISKFFRSS